MECENCVENSVTLVCTYCQTWICNDCRNNHPYPDHCLDRPIKFLTSFFNVKDRNFEEYINESVEATALITELENTYAKPNTRKMKENIKKKKRMTNTKQKEKHHTGHKRNRRSNIKQKRKEKREKKKKR